MRGKIWKVAAFAGGIAVTAIVTHYVTKGIVSVEDGADALAEQELRRIIQEELTAANQADFNGETLTYGQALSRIDSRLTTMEGALEIALSP